MGCLRTGRRHGKLPNQYKSSLHFSLPLSHLFYCNQFCLACLKKMFKLIAASSSTSLLSYWGHLSNTKYYYYVIYFVPNQLIYCINFFIQEKRYIWRENRPLLCYFGNCWILQMVFILLFHCATISKFNLHSCFAYWTQHLHCHTIMRAHTTQVQNEF